MPLGVKLVHHKGVRRGAITSVKIFGRKNRKMDRYRTKAKNHRNENDNNMGSKTI